VGAIADVLPVLHAAGYAGLDATRMLKTVLFVADLGARQVTVAACVRGDRAVNEIKVANAVGRICAGEVLELRAMHDDEVRAATGAEPGFAGPGAGLKAEVCLIEEQLQGCGPLVAGANKSDYHLAGFEPARDAGLTLNWCAITTIQAGDRSPRSEALLEERRGIEAGHIFQLGTKYSAAMNACFTDETNTLRPFIMGCYGIGSSRVVAAAVEQYHDDNGICWPIPIAPYHCVVLAAGKGDEQAQAAEQLYERLRRAGIEVVLDDRAGSPGMKFKDWDLIGVPLRIVVGRGLAEGKVECKARAGGAAEDRSLDAAVSWVCEQVAEALA
jgi:prolyl-tRNA synthetase